MGDKGAATHRHTQTHTIFKHDASCQFSESHAHTNTHSNSLYALDSTTSPPHSSPRPLIPGRGSSPRCLCLNSRDSGIIQTFHGTYLVPPRRQRRRWKMPPRSLCLHCPYSLISPSLRLALPPWCVVSAWENAGLSGCYVLRRRPQWSRGVLLEPSVPAVGLAVADTHNEWGPKSGCTLT